MKIRKMGFFRTKIRNQAMKLYKRIENLDNPDFARNGERKLLRSFMTQWQEKDQLVIFDCGANIGSWARACIFAAGKKSCRIHLFEPLLSCCNLLKQELGGNAQVRINQLAVSDSNGTAPLFSDGDMSSIASLYERSVFERGVLKETASVQVIRLDTYMKENSIDHISYLKLDVEGNELRALRGLGHLLHPRNVDAIQFEYGGANLDSKSTLRELYEILQGAGFQIFKIMRNSLEQREYRAWMENFMYSNYVAFSPVMLS